MARWDLTICGLAELPRRRDAKPSHIISILDPDEPDPRSLVGFGFEKRLTLRFYDIVTPSRWFTAPKPGHVELLLAFGRRLPRGGDGHLLIHCHGGVSRSTAATVALLAQAHPEADEDEILTHVAGLRPQAWPNSRVIAFADNILCREGRLVGALQRFYGRRLKAKPKLAYQLHAGGRSAEVAMAI